MSASTRIEWTETTWNPVTGCDRVSPGCDNCYALTLAKRLKAMGSAKYQNDGAPRTSGPGFAATEHPDTLTEPLGWRNPRKVFVNSMSDLFHEAIGSEFVARVFAVMALTQRHTYQVLTKRHGRMRTLLTSQDFREAVAEHATDLIGNTPPHTGRWRIQADGSTWSVTPTGNGNLWSPPWPLPNVWLGVSVEDQRWASIRIPHLVDTPAAVRFLSCEPLLGPLDLARVEIVKPEPPYNPGVWLDALRGHYIGPDDVTDDRIHWVIVGGESGPGARPMHPGWARSLRDQCQAAGVAFHFKQAGSVLAHQWGGSGKGGDPAQWPESFPREYPNA